MTVGFQQASNVSILVHRNLDGALVYGGSQVFGHVKDGLQLDQQAPNTTQVLHLIVSFLQLGVHLGALSSHTACTVPVRSLKLQRDAYTGSPK